MAKPPKKPPKMWVYSPHKSAKPKIPLDLKAEVTEKAEELLNELKKQHIKKPPKVTSGTISSTSIQNGSEVISIFVPSMRAQGRTLYLPFLRRALLEWNTLVANDSICLS